MKGVLALLLWGLAVIAALAVLYRIRRGRHVVLTGRWSPRFLRMVAIVLVTLGVGVDSARAGPVPSGNAPANRPEGGLPDDVNEARVAAWLQAQAAHSAWSLFKREYTIRQVAGATAADVGGLPGKNLAVGRWLAGPPPPLQELIQDEMKAQGAHEQPAPVRLEALTATLTAMEQQGVYDHWLAAYLWRRGAGGIKEEEREQALSFFARLQAHVRVANTFIAARARVQPVLMPPRAWMSKAGPKANEVHAQRQGVADLLMAVRWLHPRSDLGTWQNDGCVLFTLPADGGAFAVHRGGENKPVDRGAPFRFGRLDLVQTAGGPVTLEHEWLGSIELPGNSLVSVWDLPGFLNEEARKKIADAVDAALDGDEPAARRLEQALPFTQVLLRTKLRTSPAAKGAPRLRLILSLFDDAPTPAMPDGER